MQVLDAYLETVDIRGSTDTMEKYEIGEIQLYKATIMREAGNLEGAMTLLEINLDTIRDRLALMEMQAAIHLSLVSLAAAEQIYRYACKYMGCNHHISIYSVVKVNIFRGDLTGDWVGVPVDCLYLPHACCV